MKPAPFKYHDPTTLEEAVGLMSSLENAKALAGGQSLVPMLNMRFSMPDDVIDLNGISGLAGHAHVGDELEIGAMTRQRELEFSPLIAEICPLVTDAVKWIGHRQTRNRGTIGGSLCNLDPSAELVCVCAVLDAIVEATGPEGTRDIPFAEFPLAYMMSAIEPQELVTKIRLPLWPAETGYAFIEFARRHGDFAIVSAGVLVLLDGNGRVARAAVALGGVNVAPARMTEVEEALIGAELSEKTIADVSRLCETVDALADSYNSASYRQRLAVVMCRRALTRAAERARVPN